ncbi:MAG: pilin [Patescibacteria group bacterium]|nr:pilin [Patescibacteria group bacterium]
MKCQISVCRYAKIGLVVLAVGFLPVLTIVTPAAAQEQAENTAKIICKDSSGARTCMCKNDCQESGGTIDGVCGDTAKVCPPLSPYNPSKASTPATSGTVTPNRQDLKVPNPLTGVQNIQQLVGRVINIFVGLTGSIALLMFVIGGFILLTSGGNEQRVTQGKNIFVWSSIGLVIVFVSYALVKLVFSALGAS